ncbi:SPOR domain-containing protein [Xanthomonas sp. SS]|uniref:SPOR domain-containing protein n=1 Tax=Xanthomonas sp. SS TaxID=2724122 RepID=UPI001639FD90|nr:SPOR domain-containing protein [Xanthomonas sp. SS]QNH18809.1 SPOR domain-containing protein [Xanthomonas sp. SS]
MLVRALLVVLTILNLGVALWWATQPQTPAPAPMPALPAGVATLQLVQASAAAPQAASAAPAASTAAPPPAVHAAPAPAADVPAASAPATDAAASSAVTATAAPVTAAASPPPKTPSVAAAAAAEPAAAAPVCLSLGPYPDRAAAETAVAALGTAAPRPRLREVGDGDATSFRVLLPTIGGEDGVKAAVDRIVAAGIRDYYPIREGDAGNAIALGQYRSREGAERRKAELAKAGFNVDLIPSGGSGQSRWWLDLRTDSAAQATALRRQLGAQRQRALDCATLR